MKKYCIYRVSLPGYIHVRVVDELILGLVSAFEQLGFQVPVVESIQEIADMTPIVLLPHLLGELAYSLPESAILFNLEQVGENVPFVNAHYLETLTRFRVWDYDKNNIQALKRRGILNAQLCEIGYVPALTRIEDQSKDIDVYFYGTINDRRHAVLQALANQGLKVEASFGVYGDERDEKIGRAKVVINIHFYDTQVFEIVRASYLFANKVCLLSEYSPGISKEFRLCMSEITYDGLVEEGVRLVNDVTERSRITTVAFQYFSARNQKDFLLRAIKGSE